MFSFIKPDTKNQSKDNETREEQKYKDLIKDAYEYDKELYDKNIFYRIY